MNPKYDLNGLGVDWPVESLLTTYTKNDATMVDITSYGVHAPNPLASLNWVSAKASDGYTGFMFAVCYPVAYCITVLSCFSVLLYRALDAFAFDFLLPSRALLSPFFSH